MLSRRTVLSGVAGVVAAAAAAKRRRRSILFTGRGNSGFLNPDRRLEIVNEDGSGLRALALEDEAAGSGFGCYGFFGNGRALLQSLSLPDDWRGKTFDEYYPRSRTRIWACDLGTGRLEELCHRSRLSSFYAPCCLLPGESRLAVTVMLDGKSVLMTMNLDGTEALELTGRKEFVYGVSLSPEGRRLAFHSNYRIRVCNLDGTGVKELAAKPGALYFGSSWSPGGESVLFQLCDSQADPAHDWSAIAVARADGSEPPRILTPPAAAWFGATYGPRANPGGGSNQPQWAPDGSGILYIRRIPGSVTPWVFQAGRRDTDHFNREFVPAGARGGTHLALIDPRTGAERPLTPPTPGVWDFRAQWSPDSRRICFLRARVGQVPELWVTEADGRGKARRLTSGLRHAGAEHPVWVPATPAAAV